MDSAQFAAFGSLNRQVRCAISQGLNSGRRLLPRRGDKAAAIRDHQIRHIVRAVVCDPPRTAWDRCPSGTCPSDEPTACSPPAMLPDVQVFLAPAASRISTCLVSAHLIVATSSGWKSNVTRMAGNPHASFNSGSSEMLFLSWGRELVCASTVMVCVKYVAEHLLVFGAPLRRVRAASPFSAKFGRVIIEARIQARAAVESALGVRRDSNRG